MSDDKGKTYTEDEIRAKDKDAQRTGPDLRKVHPPKDGTNKATDKATPTPAEPKGTKP